MRLLPGREEPQLLDPAPLVAFRSGKDYEPLDGARWTIRPERVLLELPEGLPAGSLRYTGGWFPGWQARSDGGPWSPALKSEGLLATKVPAGTRQVDFRFTWTEPRDRPLGLAITLLSLLILASIWGRIWHLGSGDDH